MSSEGIELEDRYTSPKDSRGKARQSRGSSPAVAIATFLFAASQNEVGMVQNLLDEETVRVNDCDYDKRTALHVAASEGHMDVVRLLVQEGANINFADRYHSTALDDAIHHGHQDVARFLMDSGAQHGVGSNFGRDLVHAAGHGDLKTVMKLVETGIPVSSTDFDLRTPLHVAIAGRHEQIVKYLLDKGADLHAQDRYGATPLEEAHRAGVRLGDDPIMDLVHHVGGEKEHASWRSSLTNPFFLTFITIEIVIGILFAIFAKYGEGAAAGTPINEAAEIINEKHPLFMDVHVMIFIGFGFLMTFLRKYGYTAVGMTFILGALALQVYQLFGTFWENVLHDEWHEIELNVEKLILGDFAAGAVLISFGALLGKVSFTQMMLLSIFEVFFFSLNEAISLKLQIADIGGSMVIHAFGAFFGLAASKVLTPKSARGNKDNSAVYHSDIFAMIGTVFLWMYWPSFNSALTDGANRHRAVVNTLFSLTASCIFAFIFSQFWRREKHFNMIDIQNATLAGGVAMGSAADMAIHPAFALLLGAVAGTLSVWGFAVLQRWVENHLGVHDTCGVLNLHGMPGLLGGFVSAIVTASFGEGADYHPTQRGKIYPAHPGRSLEDQAKIQIAFLFITLGISLGTGFLSAILLSRLPYPKKFFQDSTSWETPAREIPYFFDERGEARHSSDDTQNATAPASEDNSQTDRQVAEMQGKIQYLENAIRAQRKALREQTRAIESLTGVRPSRVGEEDSLSLLRSASSGAVPAAGPSSQSGVPNLASMLENLTRQVNSLVEAQKNK